jgi:hypothetical protein
MKVNCLFCGNQIFLNHKIFFNHEGAVKCFRCGAMMDIQTTREMSFTRPKETSSSPLPIGPMAAVQPSQ